MTQPSGRPSLLTAISWGPQEVGGQTPHGPASKPYGGGVIGMLSLQVPDVTGPQVPIREKGLAQPLAVTQKAAPQDLSLGPALSRGDL